MFAKFRKSSATDTASGHKLSHPSELYAQSVEIGDMLSRRYRGISIYTAVMFLLAVAIVWTAVLVAEQTQQYHEDYMALQQLKKINHNLIIEHQRLTIEQQTFSATPQIASRAVTELAMFSPSTKDKLILQPRASNNSVSNHSVSNNPSIPEVADE